MSLLARVRSSLRSLFRRDEEAGEVERELQFHVEAHAADLMREGVAAAEARRRARIALGLSAVNGIEMRRSAVGLRLLDETLQDVRFGLRGLWRSKVFAATAILSLALGIGGATAMFSVVYAVLLDIYPYADWQRTVNPIVHDPSVPDDWNWFVLNRQEYEEYRAAPCFEDVFAMSSLNMQLNEEDVAQPLHIVMLSGNASAFNGVAALLGRTLQPSDGSFGDKPSDVAVLGYKFWKKHYFGDRSVVGRELKAGTGRFRIVGVMPERYTLGGDPDLYMPISQFTFPDAHYIAFAKLKKGISAAQASAYVDPMIHGFAKAEPRFYPKEFHVRLQPLLEGFTARSKLLKNFPMLYFAVGALLVIGCANCSLLLLARGTTRVHEFALRSAVGASRTRMVRQLLVECLTLSLLGSALGTGVAYVVARVPLQLAKDLFPLEAVIRINGTILAFSIGIAMLAGMFFGLMPALKFSRPKIAELLQSSGRRTIAAGSQGPLQALIACQLALTLVLLTLSGAAVNGFVHLLHLPLGYDPRNVLSVGVGFAKDTATTWAQRVALTDAIQRAIEKVPGVASASVADQVPPSGGGARTVFQVVGEEDRGRDASITMVGPKYLSTLHRTLVAGRMFTDAEAQAGLPLALVNETFARRFSPGRSIVDRMVRVAMFDPKTVKEMQGFTVSPAAAGGEVRIIGVVADAVNDGLDKPIEPNLLVSSTAAMFGYAPFLVRMAGEPHAFEHAIAHAVHEAGANHYVFLNPLSLQDMVEAEPAWRTQRLIAVLLSLFSGAALALSLVGLYSVVAYVVAQRTAEFGIRIALGAQRMRILWLVLRSNAGVILGGALLGVLVSVAVRARFARWSEYSSQSPLTIAGAAFGLIFAAFLASLFPAHRASRVQPTEALRAE